jgi:hypothetical protein
MKSGIRLLCIFIDQLKFQGAEAMTKKKHTHNKKRTEMITGILFMLAMILLIIGIDLYRHTVIDAMAVVPVVALGAAAGFVFLWKPTRSFTNMFWAVFNCVMTGGAIFYFLFFFLNSQFAGHQLKMGEFNIIRSGLLAGKYGGQPFFDIDFNGREKQLVFRGRFDHPLEAYKKVTVVYKTGLFGFEYVIEKEAMTD